MPKSLTEWVTAERKCLRPSTRTDHLSITKSPQPVSIRCRKRFSACCRRPTSSRDRARSTSATSLALQELSTIQTATHHVWTGRRIPAIAFLFATPFPTAFATFQESLAELSMGPAPPLMAGSTWVDSPPRLAGTGLSARVWSTSFVSAGGATTRALRKILSV